MCVMVLDQFYRAVSVFLGPAAGVWTLPMSPMCWLIQASRPTAKQKVFLSSPPAATNGTDSNGNRTGRGA